MIKRIKKQICCVMVVLLFCCGCDELYTQQQNNIEIDVVVNSVDNGIIGGRYTCQWEDSYAYYDDGKIYYVHDGITKEIEDIVETQLMGMNERSIYYFSSNTLWEIDRNDLTKKTIGLSADIHGLSVYKDEVLIARDTHGKSEYEIYVIEDDKLKQVGLNQSINEYVSENGHCANVYGYRSVYVAFYRTQYEFSGHGIRRFGESKRESYGCITEVTCLSPEHVASYKNKAYLLLQRSTNARGYENNVKYRNKDWDAIVCFDLKTEETECVYKTQDKKEQIVSFSVENDELYTLDEGILYKSKLNGANRTEIASYVGSDTLIFEYVADMLLVYKDGKIIGRHN